MCNHCSCVQLLVTPWTIALQTSLFMESSRQEFWSGLPCLPFGYHPDLMIEPMFPALLVDYLSTESPGKPAFLGINVLIYFETKQRYLTSWTS